MQYRTEIDGLRALAVLPVILYHAGFSGFSGGFVGVDVFFVISGYLITSIIFTELQAGSFSLSGFYERRARRILPALFLVLACCLPVVWWLLLPHELVAFARSLLAVVLFVSNLLFWQETDYFATDADLIPLLHTWSLAVEEQYYLFFPLLLLLCRACGKRGLMALLGLIALVSLAFSEWGWPTDPAANFYLIPTRAWELMLGALAALYLQQTPPQAGLALTARWVAELLSALGIFLILLAVFMFDTSVHFPGLYALVPTLGAVCIILFASPATLAGKLLSLPPLVWVGLISYSAYLWHQPLLAFARIQYFIEPDQSLLGGVALLSLLLAWLSWRFVEKPFRNKQAFSRPQIFILSLLGSAAFAVIALILVMADGVPARFSD